MIWVHAYAVGKCRNREMKTIHRSEKSAIDMCSVLGGSVQAFIPVEDIEQMRNLLLVEISEIIDDFSTEAPGSAGSFEPGSTEWDLRKVKAINMIQQILDGDC